MLTIRKNCADEVRARIGNLNTAREAYQEFQNAYEGRITTEFYALLDSISSVHFDDKKNTIDEHIVHFERAWNSFAGIVTRADLTKDDGFGDGLQRFAKSDKAKAEFLLRSLPSTQYANTIDNIHAKDYRYDDAARKLREYVPAKQAKQRTQRARKGEEETGNHPVVLQISEKSCAYCKAKGWRGVGGHTANKCFTKNREMNNRAIQNQELRRDNYRRSRGTAKRARTTNEEGRC